MLFNIRIFTATLGSKNSLTKRQVFPNVAANEGCRIHLENYLHSAQTPAMPKVCILFCTFRFGVEWVRWQGTSHSLEHLCGRADSRCR